MRAFRTIAALALFACGADVTKPLDVSSVSPEYGLPGTQVTLRGSGFGDAKGSVNTPTGKASISRWTDTSVSFALSENSTSGEYTVRTAKDQTWQFFYWVTEPSTVKWASVSVGGDSACAIDDSGKLYCWGHTSVPGRFEGTNLTIPFPLKVEASIEWEKVVAADYYAPTCGVSTEGLLHCWGFGPTVPTKVFDQVVTDVDVYDSWCQVSSNAPVCYFGAAYDPKRSTYSFLPITDAIIVRRTSSRDCALTMDGSVLCWNNDRTSDHQPTKLQYVPPLKTLALLNWADAICGIVASDDSIFCSSYLPELARAHRWVDVQGYVRIDESYVYCMLAAEGDLWCEYKKGPLHVADKVASFDIHYSPIGIISDTCYIRIDGQLYCGRFDERPIKVSHVIR